LLVATDPTSKAKDQNRALFVDGTLNDIQKRESVSRYYGEQLSSSEDLKTNACCTAGSPPTYIQQCIHNVHPEVVSRYYGCGLCLPQYPLDGCHILDLGSGSGRDVYIASQLVGKNGKVWNRLFCLFCLVGWLVGCVFLLTSILFCVVLWLLTKNQQQHVMITLYHEGCGCGHDGGTIGCCHQAFAVPC
jgi:hypothetical protein